MTAEDWGDGETQEPLYQRLLDRLPGRDIRRYFQASTPPCSALFTQCRFDMKTFNCCQHHTLQLIPIGVCHELR